MAEPDKMVVAVAGAVADALSKRGMGVSMHMPGDERIDFYEGIAEEVIVAIGYKELLQRLREEVDAGRQIMHGVAAPLTDEQWQDYLSGIPGLRIVVTSDDILDPERDWAGEVRNDPEDGNAYVLRSIELAVPHLPERGYFVRINDIMGGHSRRVDADEWIKWEVA